MRLSTDTMLKQRANHSDLGAADYRWLPDLVERGVTIGRRRRSLSFFGAFNGRWYRAVVKRTERTSFISSPTTGWIPAGCAASCAGEG